MTDTEKIVAVNTFLDLSNALYAIGLSGASTDDAGRTDFLATVLEGIEEILAD